MRAALHACLEATADCAVAYANTLDEQSPARQRYIALAATLQASANSLAKETA
jgi:hypothetical protein